MRPYQAIIVAGFFIAISSGGAVLFINRYEVGQPFNPYFFNRVDRWTGRVEQCSSIYDEKTYCGSDLRRRASDAVNAANFAASETFLRLGYTQDEINRWPETVLQGARNIVGNGGSDATLTDFLKTQHVR